MAQGLFIGSGNVAKKARNAYIGVNGVAKKIKKIYIGDANGIARTVYFNPVTLESVNATVENLSFPSGYSQRQKMYAGTTSDKNHAFFMGGQIGSNSSYHAIYTDIADVYNSSLTKVTLSANIGKNSARGVTNLGNNAVIFGGLKSTYNTANVESGSVTMTDIHTLNNSLTFTLAANLPTGFSNILVERINNDYAVFCGNSSGDVYSINSSLTVSKLSNINESMLPIDDTSSYIDNSYAIFCGGTNLEVYNSSGTKVSTSAKLSTSRFYVAGASTGNHALFAGGNPTYTSLDVVDIVSKDLVVTTTKLSKALQKLAGFSSSNGSAYFMGGEVYTYNPTIITPSNTIESFDSSLVRKLEPVTLNTTQEIPFVFELGNYIIVTGGIKNNAPVPTIQVFKQV